MNERNESRTSDRKLTQKGISGKLQVRKWEGSSTPFICLSQSFFENVLAADIRWLVPLLTHGSIVFQDDLIWHDHLSWFVMTLILCLQHVISYILTAGLICLNPANKWNNDGRALVSDVIPWYLSWRPIGANLARFGVLRCRLHLTHYQGCLVI